MARPSLQNMLRPRSLLFLTLGLLLSYSILSVSFTALSMGPVFDEGFFQNYGQVFLSHRNSTEITDHPPVAAWVGVLVQKVTGSTSPAAQRWGSVLLFSLSLLTVAFLLAKHFGLTSALLYAFFLAFEMNLKLFGALHVSDGVASSFFILSSLLFFISIDENRRSYFVLSALLMGLSYTSKISMLYHFPILLGFLFLYRRDRFLRLMTIYFFLSLLGGWMGYLGSLNYLTGLKEVFGFSMAHNRDGHLAYFLGEYGYFGWWYYFIVLFFVKSLPGFLVMWLGSIFLALRNWDRYKKEIVYFLPSCFFLFFLLSRAQAQVGYRYFFPGLYLLIVFSSLVLSRWIDSSFGKMKPRRRFVAGAGFVLLGFFVFDLNVLKNQSYLSYSNFLLSHPTRQLTDTNMDWHQGIPRHQKSLVASAHSLSEVFSFLSSDSKKPQEFVVGASELVGFWSSPLGPLFKSFQAHSILSGAEIFSVTSPDLFRQMKKSKPRFPSLWMLHKRLEFPWGLNSIEEVSADSTMSRCAQEGKSSRLNVQPLSMESPPDSHDQIEFNFESDNEKDSVIFIESSWPGDWHLNGTLMFAEEKHFPGIYHPQIWFSAQIPKGKNHLALISKNRNFQGPLRILILSEECF